MTQTKSFTLKSAGGPAKAVLFGIELRGSDSGRTLAVTALLDTGADITCVSRRAADLLALPESGLLIFCGGIIEKFASRLVLVPP